MVYVNNKKFACESCIKGHRSSACHHTERPLFEIKKKGRPVSQCTKCRELRQAKKVHNKCTCSSSDEASKRAETSRLLAGTRQKRYIPIVPALPNGLQDILRSSRVSSPADARQRVDTLLNPCNCKSIWKCKCRAGSNGASSESRRGLDALVCAAEMQQSASTWGSRDIGTPYGSLKREMQQSASVWATNDIGASYGSLKRGYARQTSPGNGSRKRARTTQSLPTRRTDFLDRFLACAAALPAPPPNRRTELDPMDVTIYPDAARDVSGDMGLRFGLVNLPKLQCCGGRCQCAGVCNCGNNCNGSCPGESRNLVPVNMAMPVESFAHTEACVA